MEIFLEDNEAKNKKDNAQRQVEKGCRIGECQQVFPLLRMTIVMVVPWEEKV